MDASSANSVKLIYNNNKLKDPSQTVNGVVVYTMSATTGAGAGKPMYQSYVENNDLNTVYRIATNNPNETAKMVLSLKFNK